MATPRSTLVYICIYICTSTPRLGAGSTLDIPYQILTIFFEYLTRNGKYWLHTKICVANHEKREGETTKKSSRILESFVKHQVTINNVPRRTGNWLHKEIDYCCLTPSQPRRSYQGEHKENNSWWRYRHLTGTTGSKQVNNKC